MKKILVVAVHPDDETLMCGGTLLKHKAGGDKIYWLIVTDINKEHGWGEAVVTKRDNEIQKVEDLYDFDKTFNLNFPTTKLDEIPLNKIIESISNVFNEVQPNIIYLPNRSDIHSDHKIAFHAAYSCTKNFRYPFIERVLAGETMSETEFVPALPENIFTPNVFIDITNFLEQKLNIFETFNSEVMKNNYPRSISAIKSLARFRGSSIGKKYAESFMLLKEIK